MPAQEALLSAESVDLAESPALPPARATSPMVAGWAVVGPVGVDGEVGVEGSGDDSQLAVVAIPFAAGVDAFDEGGEALGRELRSPEQRHSVPVGPPVGGLGKQLAGSDAAVAAEGHGEQQQVG